MRPRKTRTPEAVAFGAALLLLRTWAGRTQHEIATAAKITKEMISNYERGVAYPALPTLLALLPALGADFCDLQRAIKETTDDPPARLERMRRMGKAMQEIVARLGQEGT